MGIIPQSQRPHHPVSAKALLFSPDRKEVLAMQYFWSDDPMFGLPGGHVELGEHPDETILRELREELGIVVEGLQREDFGRHENGKILLIYSGTLARDTVLAPSQPEGEIGKWVRIDDVRDGTISLGSYASIALRVAAKASDMRQ